MAAVIHLIFKVHLSLLFYTFSYLLFSFFLFIYLFIYFWMLNFLSISRKVLLLVFLPVFFYNFGRLNAGFDDNFVEFCLIYYWLFGLICLMERWDFDFSLFGVCLINSFQWSSYPISFNWIVMFSLSLSLPLSLWLLWRWSRVLLSFSWF